MSESTTPVVDVPSESKQEAPKVASPAQDLREIQSLLLGGMFPGNVAPSVVKAFHLLDAMAKEVEAKHEAK